MEDDTLQKTLDINLKQKEFYNSTDEKAKKNAISRMWSQLRNGLLSNFRKQYDIKQRVYAEHKVWLGDLSDKKVLDLGCLKGNALSIYMAENAKQYIGIDLSDVAIAHLNTKLQNANCRNATALAVDFLSPEFAEKDFDIIYAYGVLHHFEDFDLLLAKLDEKLKSDGKIISYDPLETSAPIKMLRVMYRPFQSDKDWEWPFRRSTFKKIQQYYNIEQKRGVLGKSKYGVVMNALPLGKTFKDKYIQRLIDEDWNLNSWSHIYSCMHITMLLAKK